MSRATKIVTGIGAAVAALGLTFERNEEGRIQRANLWGTIPIYDRARGEARRARREAKRDARKRDGW
jgi:hypothetical protein